jgi:flagella basal body P-ring formation protein FlgA
VKRFCTIGLALSLLVILATDASAADHKTTVLQQRLAAAIKMRRQLPANAKVSLMNLRIGNARTWEQATAVHDVVLPQRTRATGIIAAKVQVTTAQGIQLIWVRCRANIRANVVVTRRPLNRKHVIQRGDVHLVRRFVGSQTYFYHIGDVLGKSVRSTLVQGIAITSRGVQPVIAVKRGDHVKVTIRRGTVRIRTSGEALTKGRVGDRIRVRINATGKMVQGRVSGSLMVEVI